MARMVPEAPTASSQSKARKRSVTGSSSCRAASSARCQFSAVSRPSPKWARLNVMQPMYRLSMSRGASSPAISSVLPPPMSTTSLRRCGPGRVRVTPRKISRASSMPEMVSMECPSARSASMRNSPASTATRSVLVPTARTSLGAMWRSLWPKRRRHSIARSRDSGLRRSRASSPEASCTISRRRSTRTGSPPLVRATSMWKLLEPRSTAAMFSGRVSIGFGTTHVL